MPLRLCARLSAFWFEAAIASVRLEFARFDPVIEESRKHFVDDVIAQCRILDWECHLHASQKIPRHPVGAGQKNLRVSVVVKTINPAVLQKTSHNADYPNVFAHA